MLDVLRDELGLSWGPTRRVDREEHGLQLVFRRVVEGAVDVATEAVNVQLLESALEDDLKQIPKYSDNEKNANFFVEGASRFSPVLPLSRWR